MKKARTVLIIEGTSEVRVDPRPTPKISTQRPSTISGPFVRLSYLHQTVTFLFRRFRKLGVPLWGVPLVRLCSMLGSILRPHIHGNDHVCSRYPKGKCSSTEVQLLRRHQVQKAIPEDPGLKLLGKLGLRGSTGLLLRN